jgi:glutamate formiminotransferase
VIVEAVPNFSEGRRRGVCEAIAEEARRAGAAVADLHADPDHNRSVLTLLGDPGSVAAGALAAARKAVELIDLNRHEGQHPRMGAIDVLPFVPLRGASEIDCLAVAGTVALLLARDLGLPAFFYGAAATRPERRSLEDIRRPRFEGLRDLVGSDPQWAPDCGPARVHPTAGCVAVGVRPVLVAYNVELETADVAAAKGIARAIRERDGGLPGIKALGLFLPSRGRAQVSINVCDPRRTGLGAVFRAVEAEAAKRGTAARSSEIVGLVPRAALPPEPERTLKLAGFHPRQVLEAHLP